MSDYRGEDFLSDALLDGSEGQPDEAPIPTPPQPSAGGSGPLIAAKRKE